jgi:hypothetical protein
MMRSAKMNASVSKDGIKTPAPHYSNNSSFSIWYVYIRIFNNLKVALNYSFIGIVYSECPAIYQMIV